MKYIFLLIIGVIAMAGMRAIAAECDPNVSDTVIAPDTCVMTSATSAVCAQCPEPDKWHYSLTPYAWLSSISGDVTVRGLSSPVDIGISEIIKKLNWITQLHIEAEKGDWGYYLDPTFVKISSGASAGDLSASFGFRQWLVESAVTYQLMKKSVGAYGGSSSLKALVGFRYWNLNSTLSLSGGRSGSATRQWVDPIIGGRYSTDLNRKLSFILQSDVGGFGAASEFTWSVAPVFAYHLSESQSLIFGYRALGVDYSTGSGSSLFNYDVTYHGPIIGYSFGF